MLLKRFLTMFHGIIILNIDYIVSRETKFCAFLELQSCKLECFTWNKQQNFKIESL